VPVGPLSVTFINTSRSVIVYSRRSTCNATLMLLLITYVIRHCRTRVVVPRLCRAQKETEGARGCCWAAMCCDAVGTHHFLLGGVVLLCSIRWSRVIWCRWVKSAVVLRWFVYWQFPAFSACFCSRKACCKTWWAFWEMIICVVTLVHLFTASFMQVVWCSWTGRERKTVILN
jgi:hypothetical protein